MQPKILKRQFDEFVIKQEEAKKVLSSLVYIQYKKLNHPEYRFPQSNLLLIGDTGTGKSYMTSLISDNLNLPIITIDCSRISADGYTGDTLVSYFQKLLVYENGECSQEATIEGLRGIVIFDEFDKLRVEGQNKHADHYKRLIQQEMLRILEGDKIKIPIGSEKVTSEGKTYMFDTRNLLVICTGAFPGLLDPEEVDKVVGFNLAKSSPKDVDVLERLKSYGFIPELLGRLANITVMDKLNEEDLYQILKNTRHNIMKEHINVLDLYQIDLKFSEQSLRTIASKAIAMKTGARGLRKIINDIINPLIYEYAETKVRLTVNKDLSVTRRELKVGARYDLLNAAPERSS